MSSHPFYNNADCGILNLSGRASRGCPMKKCPGVYASVPSDTLGKGVNGLELRHASICANTVVISSNVNFVPPTTTLKCFLRISTAASHKPPNCGASSGVNFHLILNPAQSWRVLSACPLFWKCFQLSQFSCSSHEVNAMVAPYH